MDDTAACAAVTVITKAPVTDAIEIVLLLYAVDVMFTPPIVTLTVAPVRV